MVKRQKRLRLKLWPLTFRNKRKAGAIRYIAPAIIMLQFKLKIKPKLIEGKWYLEPYPSPFVRILSTIESAVIQLTEQKEIRTLDQNALYWMILRQLVTMHLEATGEIWTEHGLHKHNLEHIIGLQPAIMIIGDRQIETFDFNSEQAKEVFEANSITFTNTQLKSSAMSKSMFSVLINKTIAFFASAPFFYCIKIDSDYE